MGFHYFFVNDDVIIIRLHIICCRARHRIKHCHIGFTAPAIRLHNYSIERNHRANNTGLDRGLCERVSCDHSHAPGRAGGGLQGFVSDERGDAGGRGVPVGVSAGSLAVSMRRSD